MLVAWRKGVLSQPKQQARKHSTREQARRRTLGGGGAPLTSSEDARVQERARDLGMAGRRAPASCMHGGCCNSCARAFSGCSAPNTPPTKGVGGQRSLPSGHALETQSRRAGMSALGRGCVGGKKTARAHGARAPVLMHNLGYKKERGVYACARVSVMRQPPPPPKEPPRQLNEMNSLCVLSQIDPPRPGSYTSCPPKLAQRRPSENKARLGKRPRRAEKTTVTVSRLTDVQKARLGGCSAAHRRPGKGGF